MLVMATAVAVLKKTTVIASVIVSFLAGSSLVADAADCDVIAADLVRTTGAVIRNHNGKVIFLRHPSVESMNVSCPPVNGVPVPYVSIEHESGAPPADFFDFAAITGEFATGVPRGTLRSALVACHREVLRGRHERLRRDVRKVGIDCYARMTAPGGSQFVISRGP